MSSSSIPKKGDLLINPNTQRPIRVGSRTWINLVKKGVLNSNFHDNNVIEEGYTEIPPEQLELKIKKINEKLPIGTQAVRGRGKYANKIVKRNKPLTQEEITKSTVKRATRVVVDNIDELDEVDYDDMEKRLEQLIMEEMLNNRPPAISRNKKNKVVEEEEEELELEEFEDEEEENIDEENY